MRSFHHDDERFINKTQRPRALGTGGRYVRIVSADVGEGEPMRGKILQGVTRPETYNVRRDVKGVKATDAEYADAALPGRGGNRTDSIV